MKKIARKKIASLILIVVIGVMLMVTSQIVSVGANPVPAPFTDQLPANPNGSSLVMYNPQGLGTTTLFNGRKVIANGTVANKNINFNIYGNDSPESNVSITTSREDFYLVPNSNSFIDTGVKPDGDTRLEIFFMVPQGNTITTDPSANHPDVAGCNAVDTTYHFGGPLLLKNSKIQFLYGVWSDGDDTVTAKDTSTNPGSYINWAGGKQYHSILDAHGGGADLFLTDYVKTYEKHIVNTEDSKYANAATADYHTLYMFGQNNGSLVNPVKVGIKELRITKGGVDVRHFFAVPKGSTEFSSTPALSDCMYDTVEGKYYQGNGSFSIDQGNSQQKSVDISGAINGGLDGEIVTGIGDSDTTKYTYKDGSGNFWAADYLEVNQEENKVVLYRYSIDADTDKVSHNPERSYIREPLVLSGNEMFDSIAEKLLNIKTTHGITVLGDKLGPWMDGIIGPIVDYEIVLGSKTDSSISIVNNVISVLDLNKPITVSNSVATTYTGVIWKAAAAAGNFMTTRMSSGDSASSSITAKEILFSSDKLLQQYANEDNGKYLFEIDVTFLDVPVSTMEVIADDINIKIKIGGMLKSSAIVITNAPVSIEGVFDQVLYEFDKITVTSGTYIDSSSSQNIVTLTPTSDTITLEYTIKPKKYSVQILGKTTNNVEIDFLDDTIKNGYSGEIWYNEDELVKLNISSLVVEKEYLIQPMFFKDTCLYVFSKFQCNGKDVTGQLEISEDLLKENQRTDSKFIIYAVYQKKYIINLGFNFNGGAEELSNYELSAPSKEKFNRIGINGYAINEGNTAVIILKPDKRYSVSSISGDNGTSQIADEILVIALEQSYNITVYLKHRTIRVDFALDIVDNNHRYIFGMPEYISGGSEIDANFTNISYTDNAQTLTANQDMLDIFNYRNVAIMIFNFTKGEQGEYEKLADGKLDAQNDDFFNLYVDESGNSRICLFVIQQYLVDFSTPGFIQDGKTFKNNDLGSYTVEFIKGEYSQLGNGQFMVDFGAEIKLEKALGEYGNFLHYTGLNEKENEDELFIVYGDRYVGANFESTKLAAWIMPTIYGGSGFVVLLVLMTIFLVLRSMKLKREKLEKEAEIQDMKRKFSIADEISKLREGEDVPQS